MNERILELMPKPWVFPYPDREMYSKEQMEKFAELIVQESIEVMMKHDYHGEWLGGKIKEHFGIEE